MLAQAEFRSPVGPLTIQASDQGICGIQFAKLRDSPSVSAPARRHLAAAISALEEYFAGRQPVLPALDLQGTPFQQQVWWALLSIPWGEVRTYGELAGRLGRPAAARAVGGANHANPVPILVPCHRVVQSGGRLGGYGGGLETKAWLIAHEARYGTFKLGGS
jgi:methylated-DNA-[protein]-cysteine S-methyltransferase